MYGLAIERVPLRRPCQRQVLGTRVFATGQAKWDAVVARLRELHEAGRPVLVGTDSVADSRAAEHAAGRRLPAPHRAQRAQRPRGGRNRRARRRARTHHRHHQHGGTRHRHPACPRCRAARRAARHLLSAQRFAAHRPSAAGPRRAAGRPRQRGDDPLPGGRAAGALAARMAARGARAALRARAARCPAGSAGHWFGIRRSSRSGASAPSAACCSSRTSAPKAGCRSRGAANEANPETLADGLRAAPRTTSAVRGDRAAHPVLGGPESGDARRRCAASGRRASRARRCGRVHHAAASRTRSLYRDEMVFVDTRVPEYVTLIRDMQRQQDDGRRLEIVLIDAQIGWDRADQQRSGRTARRERRAHRLARQRRRSAAWHGTARLRLAAAQCGSDQALGRCAGGNADLLDLRL